MHQLCQKITTSAWFSRFIILTIIAASVVVGMETYPRFGDETELGKTLNAIQEVILWIFVVEAALKIGSCGAKPWEYFLDPWNVFDFTIVAICFLPLNSQYAAVFRLARILRVLRLVTALPHLQLLVGTLIKSIPSLGYIGILLLLHFYIFAVMGTFMFHKNDPVRFGTLHESMLSLFQVLTLEGWNDTLNTQYLGSDKHYPDEWKEIAAGRRVAEPQPIGAAAYFIAFIMLGTMIMLNLFTGVIISSMEESQEEVARERAERIRQSGVGPTIPDEIGEVESQLKKLADELKELQIRLRDSKP